MKAGQNFLLGIRSAGSLESCRLGAMNSVTPNGPIAHSFTCEYGAGMGSCHGVGTDSDLRGTCGNLREAVLKSLHLWPVPPSRCYVKMTLANQEHVRFFAHTLMNNAVCESASEERLEH